MVYALAHATGKTGRFTLIERWRNNERLLAPQEHPLKVRRERRNRGRIGRRRKNREEEVEEQGGGGRTGKRKWKNRGRRKEEEEEEGRRRRRRRRRCRRILALMKCNL